MKKEIKYMYGKNLMKKSAFSLAEILVVLIVMVGIILLAGRFVFSDRQKQYDAKFNKLSSSISANIENDLMRKSGFDYSDYYATTGENTDFQNAVKSNLNQTSCGDIADCWSKERKLTIDSKKYDLDNTNWNYYKLNDNSIMAVKKDTPDIVIDVNGPKGPNMVGQDIRAYDYPNKQVCEVTAKPSSSVFTFAFENTICKWIKSGCVDNKRELIDNDKCLCINRADDYDLSKWAFTEPICDWDCKASFAAAPKGTDGSVLVTQVRNSKTAVAGTSSTGTKVVENKGACDYTYTYNCKKTGNRKISSDGTSCPCVNTNGYFDNTTVIGKHHNGVNEDCSWSYECREKAYASMTGAGTSTSQKSCQCITGVSNGTYDPSKHNLTGWINEVQNPITSSTNPCQYTYTCKTGTGNNSYSTEKHNLSERIAESQNSETANSEPCKYVYKCIPGKELLTKIGYNETYEGYSRVNKTTKTLQNAAEANNCENKVEYTYSCLADTSITTKIDFDEKISGYANEKDARVKEETEKTQIAGPANNCENKVKFIYSCKSKIDKDRNDTIGAYSRVQTKIDKAEPKNNCINTYTYTCKSTTDKDRNDTIGAYSRVQTKIDKAEPKNNCVNTYTYTCKSTTDSNYNETYHGYAAQSGARVQESKTAAAVSNNCVNTYTYTCKSTTDKDRNDTIGAYSRVKTKIDKAVPKNNCVNTYSYSCKSTKDKMYNATYHGYAAQSGARIQENKIAASVLNNCVNEYSYSCKSTTTTTTNSGYNTTYEGYAPRVTSLYTDTTTQKASVDNNCEKKVTRTYSYTCKTGKNNNTYDEAKHNDSCTSAAGCTKRYIETTPTLANQCKYSYTERCKLSDYPRPADDGHVIWTSDINCVWTANCPSSGNRAGTPNYSTTATRANKITMYIGTTKKTNIDKTKTISCPCTNPRGNYDSSTINTPERNESTCVWTYNCKKNDVNIVRTGDGSSSANKYKCVCKTGTANTTYDTAKHDGVNWNEKQNSVTASSDACKYTYTCVTGTSNTTHDRYKNRNWYYRFVCTGGYNSKNECKGGAYQKYDYVDQNFAENICEYSYDCQYGTANKTFDETYHALAVKNTVMNESQNALSASGNNKCKYNYDCRIGESNTTFKKAWKDHFCGLTAEDYPSCSNVKGKQRRFKISKNPKTASKNKCEYSYECSSYYKQTGDIEGEFADFSLKLDTEYVTLTPSAKQLITYRNGDITRKITKTDTKIVIDNGACDFIYTYECKTLFNNPSYKLWQSRFQTASPTLANGCKYKYNTTECPDYGSVYVVWRGSSAAKRTLKNVIEIGSFEGNLPEDFASKIGQDRAFYTKSTVPSYCSSGLAKAKDRNNTSGTACTQAQKDSLIYPDKNIAAYVFNESGKIIDTIYASDNTNNELITDLEDTFLELTRINKSGNTGLEGTIYINGCPYPIKGYARFVSPLVLDLNGDGLRFTSVRDGVKFDIDADGIVDKVAWTTRQRDFDNAFLVYDKNDNGQVDNGSELFGDQNGAKNGFEELAKYDDNKDGKIDKKDAIYSKLRLWVDFNKNAKVESKEWKTLEEAGVTEISTSYDKKLDPSGNAKTDEYGNDVSLTGTFKRVVEEIINGVKTVVEKIGTMVDVFFKTITGK